MSDDEFGLSSSDEADLIVLEQAATNKRKAEVATDVTHSKKPRTGLSIVATVARRILQEHFGLRDFRLKQAVAIERILDGGSSVVVFPTGKKLPTNPCLPRHCI